MPKASLYAELVALCFIVCAFKRCHVLTASLGVIFEKRKRTTVSKDWAISEKKDEHIYAYIHLYIPGTGRYRVSHDNRYC